MWLSGAMWLFLTNGFEWKWYLQVQHFMAFVVLSVTLSLWYGNIAFEMLLLNLLGPWVIKMKKTPYWPTMNKGEKNHDIQVTENLSYLLAQSTLADGTFHSASLDVFNNTKSLQFFISHFSLHHNSCHPLLRTSAIIYAHVKGRWNHWWGKLAIMNWIQRKASTVKT